ncbi:MULTISPECIES: hypothetical protein [unclassified Streptomyces]|uniref:hypothetical protein n=1 Tax=unclassified Streptomyces TaxID=2593676 RepID=UPI000CD59F4A|nr:MULTISPECIES: hypothetical protein [unclassified Streptomyces]AWL39660.1 hypothetical protein B9S64_17335 [Streptomyces sp. SM18]
MTTHVLATEGGPRLALLSCVLRQKAAGAGWEVLADSAHAPSGVNGLIQHPDHLEITHPVGAVRVSSVQVTVDEYYAARALRCGVSVGLDLSRIYLYSGASTSPVAPASLYASSGNLWVTGLLELG